MSNRLTDDRCREIVDTLVPSWDVVLLAREVLEHREIARKLADLAANLPADVGGRLLLTLGGDSE